jgi:hypothetical protein
VLIPATPLLKEWAYAGMFLRPHGSDRISRFQRRPGVEVHAALILVVIVVASWALRPASRKLESRVAKMSEAAAAARVPLLG